MWEREPSRLINLFFGGCVGFGDGGAVFGVRWLATALDLYVDLTETARSVVDGALQEIDNDNNPGASVFSPVFRVFYGNGSLFSSIPDTHGVSRRRGTAVLITDAVRGGLRNARPEKSEPFPS
jgi:hypothetical protein